MKVPRDICAHDGGNMNADEEVDWWHALVGFSFTLLVIFMFCRLCRRRRAVPITHNIAMHHIHHVSVGQVVDSVPMGSPVTYCDGISGTAAMPMGYAVMGHASDPSDRDQNAAASQTSKA